MFGEDRVSKNREEDGTNQGFWQLIEVERIRRQPTLLIGATDSQSPVQWVPGLSRG
jgi:hypothetical protein